MRAFPREPASEVAESIRGRGEARRGGHHVAASLGQAGSPGLCPAVWAAELCSLHSLPKARMSWPLPGRTPSGSLPRPGPAIPVPGTISRRPHPVSPVTGFPVRSFLSSAVHPKWPWLCHVVRERAVGRRSDEEEKQWQLRKGRATPHSPWQCEEVSVRGRLVSHSSALPRCPP